MRIAINTFVLSSKRGQGGPGRYLAGLINGLAAIDSPHSIYLLCNHDNAGFMPDVGKFRKILCGRLTESRPTRILCEQLLLPLYVKHFAIDVLHSPNFVAPALVPSCSVLTIHDMTWFSHATMHRSIKSLYFTRMIPLSASVSQKVITVSHASKAEILRFLPIPEYKISPVYNGVDLTLFHPVQEQSVRKMLAWRYGIPDNPFILTIGKIHPRKNVLGLVKAFGILKSRGCVHKLVVAGEILWGRNELLAPIHSLGLKNDVIFTGYVQDVDLPSLYSNADVFVYPSFFEGFGLPVLEAMACGTPVITSNISSLPEVAGDAGLLIDPYDIEALADNIWKVITDHTLQEHMRIRGLEWVKGFTWEATARKTMDVYEEAYKLWRAQRS